MHLIGCDLRLNWVFLIFQIIFYYGATDHWCPVCYYYDIRKDFPHGDLRLCERGFRHAFVLDAGSDVAKIMVEWIRADLREKIDPLLCGVSSAQ